MLNHPKPTKGNGFNNQQKNDQINQKGNKSSYLSMDFSEALNTPADER